MEKTTFINLLMRFYDVNQGNIKIDGKSIDGLSRHALRSSYGNGATGDLDQKMEQSGKISHLEKPDATDEDIIRVAKRST